MYASQHLVSPHPAVNWSTATGEKRQSFVSSVDVRVRRVLAQGMEVGKRQDLDLAVWLAE